MAYDGYINIDTRINTTEFKTGIAKMQLITQNGAKMMVAALATVTAAVAGIGAAAINVGSNFEAAMSKVSAISGATGDDLEALTNKAEEMGATTKFSATESAQALQYMAMAGWDTESMLNGIDGIMNLAAADGLDLATTSDIVTDALTAFGLSASDSTHFADVLATASSNANTNVSMLGESFKYVAPLAGTMGYSIEDMSLALGLMANSSVKGSQAGTSLKTALANMAKPTKQMQKYMDKLGLSITDTDGNMKPLRTVLVEMRDKFSDLSTAEQTAAASAIFGKEAMSGMLAIINASDEDFEKLANAIDNADGTAEKMAETLQNNLRGQITILKSSLEGLGIQIYDEIKDPLTETAKSAIESIGEISDAFAADGISGAAATIGEIFANALAGIAESASHIGDVAFEFIEGFCTGISDNLMQIRISSKQIVQSLIDGFIALLPTMVDSASELIGVAAVCIDRFIDGIKQNSRRIGNAAKDVVKALAEGIVTILPAELQKPISDAMKAIEKSFNNGGLKKALETFKTAIKKVGTSAKDIVSKYLVPLVNVVDNLAEHIDIIIPLIVAWKTALTTMTAVKTAAAAISAMTTATTAESIATAASTGALTLKQLAVAVLTDEITLATAAQYAYNAAVEANPIGIIITLIAMLAAGYAALTLTTDDQTQAEKDAEQAEERLQQRLQDYNDQLEIYAQTLSGVFDKAAEFQSGIETAGSCLDGFNDSILMSSDKQQELATKMDEVQTEISEIARTATEERRQLTQTEIDRLDELFKKEKELADQQLRAKQEYQNTVKDIATDLVANEQITVEEYEAYAQRYINTAQTVRDETIAAAEQQRTNSLAEYRSLIGEAEGYTEEGYKSFRESQNEWYSEQVDSANKTCADTLQIISDGYLDRSSALSDYVDKMRGYNDEQEQLEKEYNEKEVQLKQEYWDNIQKAQEEHQNDYSSNTKIYNDRLAEIEAEYNKKHYDALDEYTTKKTNIVKDKNSIACDEVVQDQLSAWLTMQSNTELYGGKLTSSGKVVLDTFVGSFDELPDDMRQQSSQAMEGMLQGLEDREPALYAKADNIANNIINKLRSAFDIHSPSRVTRKIFTQVIQGGEVGIEKESPKLYETAEDTASVFTERMKRSLSAADLVTKMQNAVYSSNRSVANVASARVEHIISRENNMAYQQPSSLTAQGTIENHLHIDGREAAIILTPYISEELAFS